MSERKRMLDTGIKLGYQFELFDELVILLKHKLEEIDYVESPELIGQRLEEINNCISKSQLLLKSKNFVYLYIYDSQKKSIDQIEIADKILSAANEVYLDWQRSKVNMILYSYYMLKAQHFHYIYKYNEAFDVLVEQSELIEKCDSVFTIGRLTLCYTNISYTLSYLFRFREALDYMYKAKALYVNQRVEFVNFFKESEVFLNIYVQDFPQANLLVEEIKDSGLNGLMLQVSRTNYLHATIKFLQGNYKESFFLLQETKEIEGDKEGWNIGIRLLHIFLTLETEKVDLADQRIGSLRKHIERTTKMKSVRKRDVIIFRILTHLSRSGFDFKEVWEDRQKDFRLLRSNDPDCRWIPRSHELILFDQWFEAKAKGVKYTPVFPTESSS